uniref:Immunoglobulin V-set domain-containing protein n=1 Tax=Haplochromis burtoni TaxID=8153 RepID=A0A3Q2VXH4_HAPBU
MIGCSSDHFSSLTILCFSLSDKKFIIAVMGQTVTLPCQALSSNNPIIAAEWSRVDLEPKYVLYYQDYKLFPYYQHPSFKNRVHLKDRKMKDKDMSLILKNVTINDTGTYELCREEGSRGCGKYCDSPRP